MSSAWAEHLDILDYFSGRGVQSQVAAAEEAGRKPPGRNPPRPAPRLVDGPISSAILSSCSLAAASANGIGGARSAGGKQLVSLHRRFHVRFGKPVRRPDRWRPVATVHVALIAANNAARFSSSGAILSSSSAFSLAWSRFPESRAPAEPPPSGGFSPRRFGLRPPAVRRKGKIPAQPP